MMQLTEMSYKQIEREVINCYRHRFFKLNIKDKQEMEIVLDCIDALKADSVYVKDDDLFKELVWEVDVKKQKPTKEFFGFNVIARRNTL